MELKDICIDNHSYREILDIFKNSRINPPKKYKRHIHHIIPKCWYKMNNLPIDNSSSNLIGLSIQNHYKVHKLMCDCIIDSKLRKKMKAAVEILKEKFGAYLPDENKSRKSRRHCMGKSLDKQLVYIRSLQHNEKIVYMKSIKPVFLNTLIKRIVSFYVQQYNIKCNEKKFTRNLRDNLYEVVSLLDKIDLKWV